MTVDTDERAELWRLCRSCAAEIYGRKAPNARYADAVARLLFGTAAQESGFVWRRQRTPRWDGIVGGFSLWQVEHQASVVPSIAYLRSHPDVQTRAADWLWRDSRAPADWHDLADAPALLWMLRGWDRLGCLMARLHYLRVPDPVPQAVEDQARYWKVWYNTAAGKGTVEQYLRNWRQLCEPVVGAERP